MRVKDINKIITLLLLINCLFILISGCIEGDSKNYSIDESIRVTSSSDEDIYRGGNSLSYEEAVSKLEVFFRENAEFKNATVHIIQGEHIDLSGNASRWIFGVKAGNERFFFIFDPHNEVLIPWRAWLPEKAIPFPFAISPHALLHDHADLIEAKFGIQGNETIDEFAIKGSTYTLYSNISGKGVSLEFGEK